MRVWFPAALRFCGFSHVDANAQTAADLGWQAHSQSMPKAVGHLAGGRKSPWSLRGPPRLGRPSIDRPWLALGPAHASVLGGKQRRRDIFGRTRPSQTLELWIGSITAGACLC